MKSLNIGFFKSRFITQDSIIVILDGGADKILKITGPLMAGIIRILLAVALEMLVAFNIFKTVFFIIVYGAVVMHGFGV